jgi:hypothetical protein
MCKKESCVISIAIVIGIAAMMLFPLTGTADEKKEAQMYPWSQKLQCDSSACPRFQLVLDGAAVLDKETGLVWEREPANEEFPWGMASGHCYSLSLGGRRGWHLPTIEQLGSLVDPLVGAPGPTLPAGHPFINVQSNFYWSATGGAHVTYAWGVMFSTGDMYGRDRPGSACAWCVRGGETYDTY